MSQEIRPSTNVTLTDNLLNLINSSVGATGAGFIDAVVTPGTAFKARSTCATQDAQVIPSTSIVIRSVSSRDDCFASMFITELLPGMPLLYEIGLPIMVRSRGNLRFVFTALWA